MIIKKIIKILIKKQSSRFLIIKITWLNNRNYTVMNFNRV